MPELQINSNIKTKEETAKKSKVIGEVFSDYKTNSNITDAEIIKMNLFKKTNSLEIQIQSKEYIEIKEIWYFERFLRQRFQFEQVHIKINYVEGVRKKPIADEWENIVCLMAHKYPLMKPLLLLKSQIEVTETKINVYMKIQGADFLKARKLDKELENVILNLFGKKYIVNIEERINAEDILKQKQEVKKVQQKAIDEALRETREAQKLVTEKYEENIQTHELNSQNHINNNPEMMHMESEIPPIPEGVYNDADYAMPTEEDMGFMLEGMEENEPQNIIFGKPSKSKENNIKIKDITSNDSRATLSGRIVSCECRETKTGKGMLIFEIYDGTGIINCKAFAKDITEGNEISEKIQNAKAIKVTGKSGMDIYAGDITLIANLIIEISDEGMPPLPEEDNSSPLILGNSINISDPLAKITDLNPESGSVYIDGEILGMEDKETKTGKVILSIDIYDGTSTMTCKAFLPGKNAKNIIKRLGATKAVKIAGKVQMDSFSNELTIMANTIVESTPLPKVTRQDNAEVKRVELHMHTKMSAMDAMTSATDLIKRAMSWGMKSIAITDHGVVQAFPEAHKY